MTIYILALHGVVTGGPEATHQLSDALIEQGFDARLVYFKWQDLKDGLPREFPAYTGFAPEYAGYKAKLARALPDEEGAVIVVPESACHLVPFWTKAKVLVWWLSVDNAFLALGHVNLNYLRRPNVYHASQSRYAEAFTQALQLRSLGMLSDYTVDMTEYATPLPMEQRPKLVAMNARADKVIADLNAIGEELAARDPEIRCVAVAGMSRADLAALFATARVYVDLGNFPGKDRMPREAASMGCASIGIIGHGASIEAVGYAQFYGKLPETIAAMVQAPLPFAAVSVLAERDTFNAEVRDVFSCLTDVHSPA